MSSIWTIRRSATDAKLAGLCGGVAQHWGIDPVLVRVGWVLVALSGGIGLVLYLAGWLLIPVEGREKAPVDDLFGESVRRWPRELWIIMVVVASLVMFAVFGLVGPFNPGIAIVIAVIWYFGFYKGRRDKESVAEPPSADSRPAPPQPATPEFMQYPGPPTPFTEAAQAWQRRIEEHTRRVAAANETLEVSDDANRAQTTMSASPPNDWPQPPAENLSHAPSNPQAAEHAAYLAEPDPAGLYIEPPPAAPVKLSQTQSAKRLRLVSLIVLGLALSGLGIAQALGVAIPLAVYLAAALLVIGLTLVAATWFGMARGLLPLGVLLAIAVLIVTAAGPAMRAASAATSTHAYTSLAQLPATGDTEDFGTLSVDLSHLTVTGDARYAAHVDLGRLVVTVPKDAEVVINFTADLGAVRAYGTEVEAGSDLAGQVPDPKPLEPGQHTLTLDLSVDAGNIEVQR
jgi:phage shock protein PspC (stress-responsive transcriptional regulator)